MSFLGVTFSGVDETADVERLKEIRSHYFTVEWGLRLAVESHGRTAGFPSVDWISKLAPELNLSAQLWGKSAADFLRGDNTELMARYGQVWPLFRRIQISSADGIDRVSIARIFLCPPSDRWYARHHGYVLRGHATERLGGGL